MDEQKQGGSGKRKRSVAVGLGLGLGAAALLGAGQADAATEAMQLAAGDGRGSVIALLFVPALGWVSLVELALLGGFSSVNVRRHDRCILVFVLKFEV